MLQNLFSILLKSGDARPDFIASRCLVERHAVGGCDVCQSICPHEAIEIKDSVLIAEEHCTGCGLCVQACPTGALEFDLTPLLKSVQAQGVDRNPYEATVRASLKCSQVPGDTPTVLCLARVTPAVMMASVAWSQHLRLIHGDCAHCKLGGESVPEQLRLTRDIAERQHGSGRLTGIEVWNPGEPSPPRRSPEVPLSRRQALGQLFGSAGQRAAKFIPDELLPGVSTRLEPGRIPEEWLWRARAMSGKPLQPRYLPQVSDACEPCRVCETVCPTKALKLEQTAAGATLTLEVAACITCPACVRSCPTNAITMHQDVPPENPVVRLYSSVPD